MPPIILAHAGHWVEGALFALPTLAVLAAIARSLHATHPFRKDRP